MPQAGQGTPVIKRMGQPNRRLMDRHRVTAKTERTKIISLFFMVVPLSYLIFNILLLCRIILSKKLTNINPI